MARDTKKKGHCLEEAKDLGLQSLVNHGLSFCFFTISFAVRTEEKKILFSFLGGSDAEMKFAREGMCMIGNSIFVTCLLCDV